MNTLPTLYKSLTIKSPAISPGWGGGKPGPCANVATDVWGRYILMEQAIL